MYTHYVYLTHPRASNWRHRPRSNGLGPNVPKRRTVTPRMTTWKVCVLKKHCPPRCDRKEKNKITAA